MGPESWPEGVVDTTNCDVTGFRTTEPEPVVRSDLGNRHTGTVT